MFSNEEKRASLRREGVEYAHLLALGIIGRVAPTLFERIEGEHSTIAAHYDKVAVPPNVYSCVALDFGTIENVLRLS